MNIFMSSKSSELFLPAFFCNKTSKIVLKKLKKSFTFKS